MPKVTIWIRKEDEAKWQSIENKPEWLHEHLGVDILKNHVNGQKVYYESPQTVTETSPSGRVATIGKQKDGSIGIQIRKSVKEFPNFLDKKKGTRK